MEKRTHFITLRLTDNEWDALNNNIAKTNMSRSAYCRKVLSGTEIKESPSADFPYLIQEVRRVGVNINQMAKIANTTGENVSEFNELYADVRNVLDLLYQTFRPGGD